MRVIIGTYTHHTSEGIYTVNLNSKTKELQDLTLIAKTSRPSYIDFDPSTQKMYSVLEEGGSGGISIWDYSQSTAQLEKKLISSGKAPCYVKYSEVNNTIYDAHFHDERVTLYNHERIIEEWNYGEGSRPHFVDENPDTGEVYVCDYGLDKILKYKKNQLVSSYNFPKGAGPRNLCFYPGGKIVYVLGQLSNQIYVLKDNGSHFEKLQVIPTLENLSSISDGAAVRISSDGRFVYASNRGEDSIAVFKADNTGCLTLIQHVSSFGEHPRDFDISPDGKFCLVANLFTNNLVLYKRDCKTGLLTKIADDFYAPEPTCIHFIKEKGE